MVERRTRALSHGTVPSVPLAYMLPTEPAEPREYKINIPHEKGEGGREGSWRRMIQKPEQIHKFLSRTESQVLKSKS
jgi:hypothetical protein